MACRRSPKITITTRAGALAPIPIPGGTSIGIFGAVNQDGTVNSLSNPAQQGSIVSLFTTGFGSPSFGSPDGAIATSANPAFRLNVVGVWQTMSNRGFMPVRYAGPAPGLINGVDEINVQLPAGIPNPLIYPNQVTSSFDLVTRTGKWPPGTRLIDRISISWRRTHAGANAYATTAGYGNLAGQTCLSESYA